MLCTSRQGRGRIVQCRRLDRNFLCQWHLQQQLLVFRLRLVVEALLRLLLVVLVVVQVWVVLLVLAVTAPRLCDHRVLLRHAL